MARTKTETAPGTPRKRRSRTITILKIVLAILVAGWLTLLFYDPSGKPQLIVGPDTTVLTAPLRPDGTVDYAAALDERSSEGVTAENNGVFVLLRAVGPSLFEDDPAFAQAVYERLGMEPLPDTGPYLVDEVDYLKSAKDLPPAPADFKLDADDEKLGLSPEVAAMSNHIDHLEYRPWRAEDEPYPAALVALNKGPLDLLNTLGTDQRWYWPLIVGPDETLSDVPLPDLNAVRDAFRLLMLRAMGRIGRQELDDAWTDLITAMRLARLADSDPTLFSHLIADAGGGLAAEGGLLLLQSELSPNLLRRMLDDMSSLPALRSFGEALRDEHLRVLDATIRAALAGRYPKTGAEVSDSFVTGELNVNTLLKRFNAWHRRQRDALEANDYATRINRLQAFGSELEHVDYVHDINAGVIVRFVLRRFTSTASEASRYVSNTTGDLYALQLFKNIEGYLPMESMTDAKIGVFEAAIALRLYRQRHGEYPESLAGLVPEYMGRVAVDPFTNQPLHYEREGDDFLLYSIGPDLKDDHAAIAYDPDTLTADDAFDIVYRTDGR